MEKKILVAVDGCEVSDEALKRAVDMAKYLEAKIVAVTVIDQRVVHTVAKTLDDLVIKVAQDLEEASKRYLERIKDIASKKNVPIETKLLKGTPAAQITEEADKINPDFIVLGCHGLSRGITSHEKKLIGSTAERVIRMCCERKSSRSVILVTE